jgi:hypothetical protein
MCKHNEQNKEMNVKIIVQGAQHNFHAFIQILPFSTPYGKFITKFTFSNLQNDGCSLPPSQWFFHGILTCKKTIDG